MKSSFWTGKWEWPGNYEALDEHLRMATPKYFNPIFTFREVEDDPEFPVEELAENIEENLAHLRAILGDQAIIICLQQAINTLYPLWEQWEERHHNNLLNSESVNLLIQQLNENRPHKETANEVHDFIVNELSEYGVDLFPDDQEYINFIFALHYTSGVYDISRQRIQDAIESMSVALEHSSRWHIERWWSRCRARLAVRLIKTK